MPWDLSQCEAGKFNSGNDTRKKESQISKKCQKPISNDATKSAPQIRGTFLSSPKLTANSTMRTNVLQQTYFQFQRDAVAVQMYHKFWAKKTNKKCPSDPRHTFAFLKNDRNFNNAHESVQTNALPFSTRCSCNADKSEIWAKKINQKVSLGFKAHFCPLKKWQQLQQCWRICSNKRTFILNKMQMQCRCNKNLNKKKQTKSVSRIQGTLLSSRKQTKFLTKLTNLLQKTHFHFQADAIAVQM